MWQKQKIRKILGCEENFMRETGYEEIEVKEKQGNFFLDL